MCSSAIASSSAVVTPGATAFLNSSSVSATTRPAWRISAICAGVLISSLRSNMTALGGGGLEGGDRPGGHLFDAALGIDRHQQVEAAVEVDERRRLRRVDLQP